LEKDHGDLQQKVEDLVSGFIQTVGMFQEKTTVLLEIGSLRFRFSSVIGPPGWPGWGNFWKAG